MKPLSNIMWSVSSSELTLSNVVWDKIITQLRDPILYIVCFNVKNRLEERIAHTYLSY